MPPVSYSELTYSSVHPCGSLGGTISSPMPVMSPSGPIYTVGKRLGRGAYSIVFRAIETNSRSDGQEVALKLSRVSLRVKRTLLRHESRIMQLLQGHPSIPSVHAYGQSYHFEFLAIDLLGPTLKDSMPKDAGVPFGTALIIGKQMLAALEHVHSRGIVHRDVKPANILVSSKDPNRVCLIDFGLSRRFGTGTPARRNPNVHRVSIVGSLTWASLNSHDGFELSPRDDLESLAYTLLFLLRGNLPWRRAAEHRFGTIFGALAEVRELKKGWNGTRISEGYPPEFGQLLDYARALEFSEMPDYHLLESWFNKSQERIDCQDQQILDWSAFTSTVQPSQTLEPFVTPDCVVVPGQFVNVQLSPRVSIEGFPNGVEGEDLWRDPTLSNTELKGPARPAIVLTTVFDSREKRFDITVAPLRRGAPSSLGPSVSIGPSLIGAMTNPPPSTEVHLLSQKIYCYSFPHAYTFVSADRESTRRYWSFDSEGIKFLQMAVNMTPSVEPLDLNEEDSRALRSMRKLAAIDYAPVYARFTPLHPENMNKTADGVEVDWEGERGWFDELVNIRRRRCADNGMSWTPAGGRHLTGDSGKETEEDFSNSLMGDWDPQHARDRSLTLPIEQAELLDVQVPLMAHVHHRFARYSPFL